MIVKILPDNISNIIHIIYHRSVILFNKLRWYISKQQTPNPKDIPIIINNYNRLTFLKSLIESLTTRGYNNIYILDNNSTYPPLLDYYKSCPFIVFHLNKNIGYKALWNSEVFNQFKGSYYVYTDSDMELPAECPDDFMQHFLNVLKKYPLSQKVGFGLQIDDLPNHFINKKSVIEHESKFWKSEVEKNLYRAAIDTTFALYRPYCKGEANRYQEVYRTGGSYIIKHLPWYINSSDMTEEELYYVNNITQSTHWSINSKK